VEHVDYAVLLPMSAVRLYQIAAGSSPGVPDFILALLSLAVRRFSAFSICLSCFAFTLAAFPKLYVDFPIFKLFCYLFSNFTNCAENEETLQKNKILMERPFFAMFKLQSFHVLCCRTFLALSDVETDTLTFI